MAGNVVDQVIFELDGDISPLKARGAEVEAEFAKINAKVRAASNGSFDPLVAGAKAASAAVKETHGNVVNLHGSTATATREFRALFDELSSGRTRQTPGTLAIIATRVFGISGAALAASVAIAAIPVAIAVAAAQGATEAAKIERQLLAIGNAAGVSRGQIELLAQSMPGATGRNRFFATGAAVTGNVSPGMLGQATQFAESYQRATGLNDEKALEAITKLLEDPTKGAKELEERFNALSNSQVRQIELLAKEGETRQAVDLLIADAGPNFKAAGDQAGYLEKMLHGAGGAASSFWDFLKGIGRPETDEEFLKRQKDHGWSGFGYNPEVEAAQARVDAKNRADAAAAQRRDDNERIRAAQSLLGQWDVAGSKARNRSEAVTSLKGALAAANRQGDTQAAAEYTIALRNAQNPNYRPGREGEKNTNEYQRQAETAQLALRTAREVAATDERDRATVKAKLDAELEYQRNIRNKEAAPYAKAIRDSKIAEAGLTEDAKRRDNLRNMQEQAGNEEKLAAAYERGTRAAIDQTIAGEAHAAWLKGEINDENAYAAALQRRASATTAAATARTITDRQLQIAGLQRTLGAGGSPAGAAAAARENEALAATQAERDNARTAAQTGLAEKHLQQLRQELALRDQINLAISADREDWNLQQTLEEKQAELRLKYADVELRAKEIADLQTRNRLIQEGYIVGSQAFDQELAKRKAINEQIAQADLALSGQTKSAQLLDVLRNGLESTALAGVKGFRDMRQAASSFLSQLGSLALQLYIIRPLLNMLLGQGAGGGVLGSMLSSVFGIGGVGGAGSAGMTAGAAGVFGGGRASGGPVDPSRYYLVGEHGPEFFAPGSSGRIVPPIGAPNAAGMNGGRAGAPASVHFSYEVTVAGNGDKELQDRMQSIARTTVEGGLKQYDAINSRTIRGKLVQANKRALV